eukprot:COSAG01_NODE_60069_length_296_cov_1.563452_1_plen_45_part_10
MESSICEMLLSDATLKTDLIVVTLMLSRPFNSYAQFSKSWSNDGR